MSRDQKPGKVRIVGARDAGAARPEHPLRRATDQDPNAPRGTVHDRRAPGTAAAAAAKSGSPLPAILLFLIAAAAGGALFTLYVLPGLPK
ncbi:MAG TPA: hypothetical protein VGB62_03660 [Allosphingosinicella sp.]|jgi:hypothetical protein